MMQMRRVFLPVVLSAMVVPARAAAKDPLAATVLTSKEAVALLGGPLEEVSTTDSKANSENGHDHNTVCGYFPKGYKLAEAQVPPERGIQLSLHTFPTAGEAKKFYGFTREAEQESAKALPGAKVVPLKGAGETGVLSTKTISPAPMADYQIAIAYFVKGSTMAQVTVWKRSSPTGGIATAAAKQIAAKLP